MVQFQEYLRYGENNWPEQDAAWTKEQHSADHRNKNRNSVDLKLLIHQNRRALNKP